MGDIGVESKQDDRAPIKQDVRGMSDVLGKRERESRWTGPAEEGREGRTAATVEHQGDAADIVSLVIVGGRRYR